MGGISDALPEICLIRWRLVSTFVSGWILSRVCPPPSWMWSGIARAGEAAIGSDLSHCLSFSPQSSLLCAVPSTTPRPQEDHPSVPGHLLTVGLWCACIPHPLTHTSQRTLTEHFLEPRHCARLGGWGDESVLWAGLSYSLFSRASLALNITRGQSGHMLNICRRTCGRGGCRLSGEGPEGGGKGAGREDS